MRDSALQKLARIEAAKRGISVENWKMKQFQNATAKIDNKWKPFKNLNNEEDNKSQKQSSQQQGSRIRSSSVASSVRKM